MHRRWILTPAPLSLGSPTPLYRLFFLSLPGGGHRTATALPSNGHYRAGGPSGVQPQAGTIATLGRGSSVGSYKSGPPSPAVALLLSSPCMRHTARAAAAPRHAAIARPVAQGKAVPARINSSRCRTVPDPRIRAAGDRRAWPGSTSPCGRNSRAVSLRFPTSVSPFPAT